MSAADVNVDGSVEDMKNIGWISRVIVVFDAVMPLSPVRAITKSLLISNEIVALYISV